MGNTKFTIQDWAEGFAKRSRMSRAKADSFLRTFFNLIKKSIEDDNFVKIKGLGTFKLVTVGSRESVDVNTGERIEIGEHQRLIFTPDKTLKERVNRPFEQFATTVIDDDSLDLGTLDAAGEDNDDTAGTERDGNDSLESENTDGTAQNAARPTSTDHQETQDSQTPADDAATSANSAGETARNNDQLKVQSVSLAPQPETEDEPSEQELNTTDTALSQPNDAPSESETAGNPPEDEAERPYKNSGHDEYNGSSTGDDNTGSESDCYEADNEEATSGKGRVVLKYILAVLGILVLMAGSYVLGYYRFFGSLEEAGISSGQIKKTSGQIQKSREVVSSDSGKSVADSQTADSVSSKTVNTQAQKRDSLALKKQKAADDIAMSKKYEQLPGGKYLIVGTLDTHEMKPGDTLLKLSKKYFGSKDYVPYIVFYNRLENPDVVPLGYTLKIPRLAHPVN